MTEMRNNRPERKKLGMGTYYDIVAGALYVVLAYYISKNPPEGLGPGLVQGVLVIFALYGFFRIGRGIYRLLKK